MPFRKRRFTQSNDQGQRQLNLSITLMEQPLVITLRVYRISIRIRVMKIELEISIFYEAVMNFPSLKTFTPQD
jgi:hypothetical protein